MTDYYVSNVVQGGDPRTLGDDIYDGLAVLFTADEVAVGGWGTGVGGKNLSNASDFPSSGTLVIDRGGISEEYVSYSAKVGNTLTLDGRGLNSTSDVTHLAAETVELVDPISFLVIGPKFTFTTTANATAAGDTVWVRAGAHATNATAPPTGALTNPITFKRFPGDSKPTNSENTMIASNSIGGYIYDGWNLTAKVNMMLQNPSNATGSLYRRCDFAGLIGTEALTSDAYVGFSQCTFDNLGSINAFTSRGTIEFRENIVKNVTGVAVGEMKAPTAAGADPRVVNNIFINCGKVLAGSNPLWKIVFQYNTTYNCGVVFEDSGPQLAPTSVQNNNFYLGLAGSRVYLALGPPGTINSPLPGDIFSHNNYYIDPAATGAAIGEDSDGVYTTLADWQTMVNLTMPIADSDTVGSVELDPLFVSTSPGTEDLHLIASSPLIGLGTPITGISKDIDFQFRSNTAPDIGADESVGEQVAFPNVLKYPGDLQSTTDGTPTLVWEVGKNPSGGTVQFRLVGDENVNDVAGEITGASTFDCHVNDAAPFETLETKLTNAGVSAAGMTLYLLDGGSPGFYEVSGIIGDVITIIGTFPGGIESSLTWQINKALFSITDTHSKITQVDSFNQGPFEIDHTKHSTIAPFLAERKMTFEQSPNFSGGDTYPGSGNSETVAGSWADIGKGNEPGSTGVPGIDGADAAAETSVFARLVLNGEDKVNKNVAATASTNGVDTLTDTAATFLTDFSGFAAADLKLRFKDSENEYDIISFGANNIVVSALLGADQNLSNVSYNVYLKKLVNPRRYSWRVLSWNGILL